MIVTVHTRVGCPYCTNAKKWLEQKGIQYTELQYNDLTERQAMYAALSEKYGTAISTVPQIIVEDEGHETLIGGYTDLLKSEWAKGF